MNYDEFLRQKIKMARFEGFDVDDADLTLSRAHIESADGF